MPQKRPSGAAGSCQCYHIGGLVDLVRQDFGVRDQLQTEVTGRPEGKALPWQGLDEPPQMINDIARNWKGKRALRSESFSFSDRRAYLQQIHAFD